MIPTLTIRDRVIPWQYKQRGPQDSPLVDFEHAGVGLSDSSQGLRGYDWTAKYDPDTQQISIWRDDLGEATAVVEHTQAGVVQLALSFDQNMRPVLAWEDSAGVSLRRYNAATETMQITSWTGGRTPSISLDDRRPEFVGDSDVILSYIKDGDLVVRVQRELFNVEHTLPVESSGFLISGMTKELCFQWRVA